MLFLNQNINRNIATAVNAKAHTHNAAPHGGTYIFYIFNLTDKGSDFVSHGEGVFQGAALRHGNTNRQLPCFCIGEELGSLPQGAKDADDQEGSDDNEH